MSKQYWVIGGEYACTQFEQVVPGTERVYGPFMSYEEARRTWREQSLASRARATVRFSIVTNAAQKEAAQAA